MDKKPLFDSDIDPKRIHKVADGLRRQGEFESARMLDSYADLLEAREMAVPMRQFRVVPKGSTWTDVKDDEIWAAVTAHPESYETRVLYTHSVPADAERLAEALERTARHRAAADRIDPDQWRSVLYSWEDRALAAHSAQAQPPAASVTDAMVSRAWMALTGRAGRRGYENDFECMMEVERKAVRAALEAALAAQENPNG